MAQNHLLLNAEHRGAGPSVGGGGGGPEAMQVSFAVPYRCEFGQHIALVGSDEFLGDWDVRRGVPMNWQDGDVWTVDLELPPTCAATMRFTPMNAHAEEPAAMRHQRCPGEIVGAGISCLGSCARSNGCQ